MKLLGLVLRFDGTRVSEKGLDKSLSRTHYLSPLKYLKNEGASLYV